MDSGKSMRFKRKGKIVRALWVVLTLAFLWTLSVAVLPFLVVWGLVQGFINGIAFFALTIGNLSLEIIQDNLGD